jgi:hypothetical protein
MLLINSRHMLRPACSTSRLSCLLAHMQESITNLNCLLSSLRRAINLLVEMTNAGGNLIYQGSNEY